MKKQDFNGCRIKLLPVRDIGEMQRFLNRNENLLLSPASNMLSLNELPIDRSTPWEP
jgi:hypothetical protein